MRWLTLLRPLPPAPGFAGAWRRAGYCCSLCGLHFDFSHSVTLQAHGVRLGPAELLVVAFTASLAAVGAPAIPSAGLVTMLIVLQAVSLDQYAAGE